MRSRGNNYQSLQKSQFRNEKTLSWKLEFFHQTSYLTLIPPSQVKLSNQLRIISFPSWCGVTTRSDPAPLEDICGVYLGGDANILNLSRKTGLGKQLDKQFKQ